jgi:hypothetical protein
MIKKVVKKQNPKGFLYFDTVMLLKQTRTFWNLNGPTKKIKKKKIRNNEEKREIYAFENVETVTSVYAHRTFFFLKFLLIIDDVI